MLQNCNKTKCLIEMFAGPTSFAPVIEMGMSIVDESRGQYHVLLIIADGQVTRSVDTPNDQLSIPERQTVDAIVRARWRQPFLPELNTFSLSLNSNISSLQLLSLVNRCCWRWRRPMGCHEGIRRQPPSESI